jgi:iron complex transport system substrate-binding protein
MMGDASDYTLDIFGNANMDDTIDEKDVAYVEDVIKGTSSATNLSDANYDGKIDALDVDQIELIINGEDKELTFIDSADRIVTVRKPIERLVVLGSYDPEALRILDATERIVGIGTGISEMKEFYPEICNLPTVGKWNDPDIEAIISLKPDAVLTYGTTPSIDVENALKNANIQMIRLNLYSEIAPQSLEKLGYIFDKENEAKKYSVYVNTYINDIKSRTKGISDDKKPKIYIESRIPYLTLDIGGTADLACVCAGGKNIAAKYNGTELDPEWIVEQNPDIIVRWSTVAQSAGYSVTDPSKLISMRDEVLNRQNFAEISAIKNKSVYIFGSDVMYLRGFIGIIYMARWFYPDLFNDLDPEAIHKEYLEKFQGMPYQGVYVYPPLEES